MAIKIIPRHCPTPPRRFFTPFSGTIRAVWRKGGSVNVHSESEVAQSCLTLCDPMDYSPPGFSVSSQARILEWVAISCSRGYSWPRDQTQSPVATALPVDSLPLSHQGSLLSIQTVRLRSLGLAHWISSLFCSITKWSWWSSQSSMTNHLHHKTTMIQHSLLSLLLCPGEARTEPALKLIYPCLPDLEITSP